MFDTDPTPPGERLREMLKEKQWTQEDLASVTGRSLTQISDIITGKRGITPEMAVALGAALNTTADYWLRLDAAYRLSSVKGDAGAVERRARLFDFAPIKEMQKRGWIKPGKHLDEIDAQLRSFFGVESFDEPPSFPVAMRKAAPLDDLNAAQRAWCFRARQLAQVPPQRPFKRSGITKLRSDLRQLAAYPSYASRVSEVLGEHGIRFIIIEPIATSKIDGCTFWLDDDSPVVALSLRFDRMDYFWFTLMHEVAHIEHGDALSIDTDLAGEERAPVLMKAEIERRADEAAADSLVPHGELDSFIRRVGPLYSKARINQFAHRIKIHPSIILGQLQHLGEIGFNAHRNMFSKVRSHIVETALTDGWKQ